MLSGNSLRQTVYTHCASVHQAAKLVAALLRVAGVTAGLVESNGSLPLGLWLTSPAGWLPRTGISSGTLRSVIEYGLPLPFLVLYVIAVLQSYDALCKSMCFFLLYIHDITYNLFVNYSSLFFSRLSLLQPSWFHLLMASRSFRSLVLWRMTKYRLTTSKSK